MDQNLNLTQSVDTLFQSLENFTQKEGLIGKPVTQGDKTFIPVVSVTLGYGGGNTTGKMPQPASPSNASSNSAMSGGALGLGAKLCTDAIIVIDKGNVSMMPMSGTAATNLVEKIPQIISGMTQNKPQGGQQQQQQ